MAASQMTKALDRTFDIVGAVLCRGKAGRQDASEETDGGPEETAVVQTRKAQIARSGMPG